MNNKIERYAIKTDQNKYIFFSDADLGSDVRVKDTVYISGSYLYFSKDEAKKELKILRKIENKEQLSDFEQEEYEWFFPVYEGKVDRVIKVVTYEEEI